MTKRILITGGAGFIGSHLADQLIHEGYRVRVLDNLLPQVHGATQETPEYLNPDAELVVGDVRDPEAVRRALKDIDAVYHFSARVGAGQSMYEVAEYTSANNYGTSLLLQALTESPVERLIVASSMSLYGEGLCRRCDGQLVFPRERPREQLRMHDWELRDEDGSVLKPVPTPETKPPALASVYALSKFDQEKLCLVVGRAYGIPTVALRFFNVYGTRQALSNPYTGVLTIFASRLLNGNPPLVFEDGLQRRDFVSVHDVARACRLALERPNASGRVFNIGSGRSYSIREIATRMALELNREHIEPEITEKYRVGDVRHCFADISLARKILGYEPLVRIDDGLCELAEWLDDQAAVDHVNEPRADLVSRGLTA